MSNRYGRLLRKQAKVKVVAKAYNDHQENRMWFVSLAVLLAAGVFYFFNIFFAFPGGRALIGD